MCRFAEVAADACLIGSQFSWERIEVGHVDSMRRRVSGREDNKGITFAQRADRMRMFVQPTEVLLGCFPVADSIEDREKGFFALAEDLIEFE